MKAARLHEYGKPFQIDDVPTPQVKGGQTLVKVVASYVCSSDIGLVKRKRPWAKMPMIPGHNVTGTIEDVGPDVSGFKKGDAVAVYGAWGCGQCIFCLQGDEQLCDPKRWVGFGPDGGYAQYLLVPAQRHLIKTDGLDPYEVASLLDAGLTAYRAIKQNLPLLYAGTAVSILGVGNIGYYAVQMAKVLEPKAKVIAVDVLQQRLGLAAMLGSDYQVLADSKAVEDIREISGADGVQLIVDTVGSDATLAIAAQTAGKRSAIAIVGLAGGRVGRLPGECSVANSVWGTLSEMKELLQLYRDGKIKCDIKRFPLDSINKVFELIATKQLQQQAVITP
jgi:propanol-preferring alcohol dehydrogenase